MMILIKFKNDADDGGDGSDVIIALCSYPLKLGSPKFLKEKAQFSLNFVPNFQKSDPHLGTSPP